MSQEFQVMLPKLGESIVSAVVIQWFKKEGDMIHLDEPLLEVSTDKVNSEIPSPVAGIVKKIVASVDQEIQVGELLAIIEQTSLAPKEEAAFKSSMTSSSENTDEESNKDFFSPSVLRLAAEKGLSLDSLKKISGTGAGGRVTKQDVENYAVKSVEKAPCPLKASTSANHHEERVKLSGMRKAIAENMVKSFYEAPHATLVNEVDVTNILQQIQIRKEAFLAKHGAKLTVTSFVVHAMAKALAEFPLLNSSLEQDTIVVKKYVNVGIAVSLDQGLIVPVIKHCEGLSLVNICQAIQDVSQRARAGRLNPQDVLEGTVTLTNFGMTGVSIGIPIIRYPEVAIVGIGAIKKRVHVIENDAIAIRSMMHVSLTFDHRIIDGIYGCDFLASLQKHLEASVLSESF